MRKVQAEPYRDIDFAKGKRGPVITPNPGKTKISIRLDNTVLDHFRGIVEAAGDGNYQSLINDALIAHIQRQSILIAMRKVVREQQRLASCVTGIRELPGCDLDVPRRVVELLRIEAVSEIELRLLVVGE